MGHTLLIQFSWRTGLGHFITFSQSSVLVTPAFSTCVTSCHLFHSRVFHPCHLVPRFPLPRFPPVSLRATFSTPAFSTHVTSCRVFHSCVFLPCIFDGATFSTPAFSVAPLSLQVDVLTQTECKHNGLWSPTLQWLIYTVSHKICHHISDHNSYKFLGGFLQFLHQWRQEWILYIWVTKFTNLR